MSKMTAHEAVSQTKTDIRGERQKIERQLWSLLDSNLTGVDLTGKIETLRAADKKNSAQIAVIHQIELLTGENF